MNLSFSIKKGLVSVRRLQGTSFSNLSYDAGLESWCLTFHLQLANGSKYVPAETEWIAVIPASYPKGTIEIFPALDNSIKHTFEHQEYNTMLPDLRWRTGKICVTVPSANWKRKLFSIEPQQSLTKLTWHIKRAIEWIERASVGRLSEFGDPFELPALPHTLNSPIAFNESPVSFDQWQKLKGKKGIVEFALLPFKDAKHSVCMKFRTNKGEEVNYEWGSSISKTVTDHKGIWVLLPAIPVMPPWQLPATWIELKTLLRKYGVDLVQLLGSALMKNPICIMLGFPIAGKIGDKPERIHWLAVQTPVLCNANGFRYGSQYHIEKTFQISKQLKWITTENWAQHEITTRSKLDKTMTSKKILFIGAGSVGSIIAELFCRMGCTDVTIMDYDMPVIGNFARHSLTMEELYLYKAEGVTKRLNSVMPYVKAKANNSSLQKNLKDNPSLLQEFDIIVDVTAEDEVIDLIEKHSSNDQPIISISTGYEAKRGFCYTGWGGPGLAEDFNSMIAPSTTQEKPGKDDGLEYEGAGCWHPLFPARYDDILSVIAPCIRIAEKTIILGDKSSKLSVIEQEYDGEENLTGIKISTTTNDTIHSRSVA